MRKIFGWIATFLFLLGCGGTEVGNPGTETGNPTDGGSSCADSLQTGLETDSALDQILYQLCERTSACSGIVSTFSCLQYVNARSEEALVAMLGPYQNLSLGGLRAELSTGASVVRSTALPACLLDIQSVSCEMIEENISFPDVGHLETIIPTTCNMTFERQPPPGSIGRPGC